MVSAEEARHQEVHMIRKFAVTLTTAAALVPAAFIPATASAGYGIGADIRDIHHERSELRQDHRDLRRDVATGRYGAARRDLANIRGDRRELRGDYRDLHRDARRLGY